MRIWSYLLKKPLMENLFFSCSDGRKSWVQIFSRCFAMLRKVLLKSLLSIPSDNIRKLVPIFSKGMARTGFEALQRPCVYQGVRNVTFSENFVNDRTKWMIAFNVEWNVCAHDFLQQRRIKHPVKHLRLSILQKYLTAFNYFHETLHFTYLTRFRILFCTVSLLYYNLEKNG